MQALPLHRYPVLRTSSLDEVRHLIWSYTHPHPIEFSGPSEKLDCVVNGRFMQRLSASYMSFGGHVMTRPGMLEYYLLQFVVVGTYIVEVGGRSIKLGRGQAVLLSPFEDVSTWWTPDTGVLSYQIGFTCIEEHMAEAFGVRPVEPLRFEPLLDAGPGSRHVIRRLLVPMARTLNRIDGIFDEADWAEQAENLLMSTLISAQPHNYSGALIVSE